MNKKDKKLSYIIFTKKRDVNDPQLPTIAQVQEKTISIK